MKSRAPHVAELEAFSAINSNVNQPCHKNVIVPSDSEPSPVFLLVAQTEIYGGEAWAKVAEPSVRNRTLANFRGELGDAPAKQVCYLRRSREQSPMGAFSLGQRNFSCW